MYNRVCADFSEINESIALKVNKGMQEGFFLNYVGENQGLMEKSQKQINMQVLKFIYSEKATKFC